MIFTPPRNKCLVSVPGFKRAFFPCALLVLAVAFISPLCVSQSAPADNVNPKDLIQFLSKTVSWYRQLAVEQQIATDPSDLTFVDDDRRVSAQVVQLAFDFARQQEQAFRKAPVSAASAQQRKNVPEGSQGLAQMADKADAQVQELQGEIDALHKKLAGATPRNAHDLQSQLAETQSELGLFQARRDVLRSMMEFASGASANGLGASGLRAQIEELARSVPSALNQSATPPANNGQQSSSASVHHEPPTGIWGLTSSLFTLSRKIHTLNGEISATQALAQTAKQLRTPLVANLKTLIQSGDQLAEQADTSGPAQLQEQKKQLDQLTEQFKQISETILPLSKQNILLNLYERTLTNWRDSVKQEYNDDLRSLLLRVIVLLVIIGVVIGVGEVWRRTIFRYVHDTRRRYQFLLLRKIVIWVAIAIIIALTFATELTSVATFAGLLTAGVAVALQNVILSIVGYFFLIGKYGIRVGDRVQIAGVTGEVVDVGLVRMQILELGSGGADSQPSGRVVAFSNSIVFQPTSGLFKQIAGANFIWHEITLTFAPGSEYHVVKERVIKAVNTAFAKYQQEIERQQKQMEASVNSMATIELRPRTRVHYTASGIEATIRFPVEPARASEIDDQIIRVLMEEINQEPKLKMLGTAIPTVKSEPSTVQD